MRRDGGIEAGEDKIKLTFPGAPSTAISFVC